MPIFNNMCELIGNTSLVHLWKFSEGLSAHIIGKLEGYNPGWCVKDRIGLSMIETAEKEGKLAEGGTIIEPTSGNTGIGLALTAAVKGLDIILTMPSSMSVERRKMLINLGAKLVLTDADKGMPGAIEEAQMLTEKIPGAFMPQQFDNPANPQIHYETTGPEIWHDTEGQVDIFVAGVGTGGTVTGVGKYLKEQNPDIQVIAVEPEESPVLSGGKMGPHMIQGIGAGFIPGVYNGDYVDEVITTDSHEAIKTAQKLGTLEGLLVGISSGAAALAAYRVAIRPENKDKNIVVMQPDTGERYISTLLFYHD
ncbi:MAG: cysteine synthase A [Opitutaceae bacterium]|nr:cysteine synthase A [Opitutaceae bacterium]|tara:strand:+ start:190 stop:1116 length:927 start_codon:yes stop_codon:yes gene_type:complete